MPPIELSILKPVAYFLPLISKAHDYPDGEQTTIVSWTASRVRTGDTISKVPPVTAAPPVLMSIGDSAAEGIDNFVKGNENVECCQDEPESLDGDIKTAPGE